MRMLDEMIDRQKLIRIIDLSERMYLARERERVSNFKIQQKDEEFHITEIGESHSEKETLKYILYRRKCRKNVFLNKDYS